MKRRDFFKAVGCSIAALGSSETEWFHLERYQYALAQPTPRKLALLVGINEYPHTASLSGCITDVELQKELLIHRFGFKDDDILTLSDRFATRSQIETAFLEHLTAQAQPGDLVVFHFSGFGRRLQLKQNLEDEASITVNSLVPVDSVPTSTVTNVNDLLVETLWLLVRSLRTDNITTILDTSFNPPQPNTAKIPANLRIRSCPQVLQAQLSTEALAFQQELDYLCTNQALPCQYPYLPGLVLTAAHSNQMATEVQWTGFSAGLFTYALTQYLWKATPATNVQLSLTRVNTVIEQILAQQQSQLSGNQPQFELPYHLMPQSNVNADGVVKLVEDGGTALLWLAGLHPLVLQYYSVNSLFQVVPLIPQSLNSSVQLQVRSRTGLMAKAQIIDRNDTTNLQVGQLVQEAIRVLPRSINLYVALDAGLERIERVDATSAFANISFVSVVAAADQPVDCLFGRLQEAQTLESPSRYALFSLSQEVIPSTAGEAGEAVKIAVQRLVPKLQTLLAAKLWRLTTNESSSRLGVKSNLELISAQKSVVMQQQTVRSQQQPETRQKSLKSLPTDAGIRIQYQICNQSDRAIYYLILGFDDHRNAIALYPQEQQNSSDSASILQNLDIAAGETINTPVDFTWVLHAPASICETQILCSKGKFTQTLAALQDAGDSRQEEHIGTLSNSLAVAQAVLQDLHNASNNAAQPNAVTDSYALDVNAWASFNFVYQVV